MIYKFFPKLSKFVVMVPKVHHFSQWNMNQAVQIPTIYKGGKILIHINYRVSFNEYH